MTRGMGKQHITQPKRLMACGEVCSGEAENDRQFNCRQGRHNRRNRECERLRQWIEAGKSTQSTGLRRRLRRVALAAIPQQ